MRGRDAATSLATHPGEPNFVEGGLGRHRRPERPQQLAPGPDSGGCERSTGAPTSSSSAATIRTARRTSLSYFSGGQRVVPLQRVRADLLPASVLSRRASTDLTPVDNSERRPITRDFGAYVQDSWKAAPNLTINAGLRFDREWMHQLHSARPSSRRTSGSRASASCGTPAATERRRSTPSPDASPTVCRRTSRSASTEPSCSRTPTTSIRSASPRTRTSSATTDGLSASGSSFGEPVDAGLKGISQDELTLGVEKTLGGTLSLGLKATYRSPASAIEDRCDLDYNSPESNGSTCAIMNPGSDGPIRPRRLPLLHRPRRLQQLHTIEAYALYGAASDARGQAHLPRHRAPRRARPSPRASGFRPPTSTRRCAATTTARSARASTARPTRASTRTSTTRSSCTTPTGGSTSTGRSCCASTATT